MEIEKQMEQYIHDKQLIFYLLLISSIILARLPYIGIYFRVINTLVHESGHAFAALITSGKLSRVEFFADTSGTATTVSKSKLSNFIISFAGYPVSSVVAYVFFRLIKFEHYDFVLYTIAFLATVNLVLFVRNKFGIFWLLTFGLIVAGIFYYNNYYIKYWSAVFFSCVILTDSVVSALILFKLSLRDGKKAGDASNLKSYTHIPSFFWSLIFVAISFYFFYLTAILFFPAIDRIIEYIINFTKNLF